MNSKKQCNVAVPIQNDLASISHRCVDITNKAMHPKNIARAVLYALASETLSKHFLLRHLLCNHF